jgi:hypothetical protein
MNGRLTNRATAGDLLLSETLVRSFFRRGGGPSVFPERIFKLQKLLWPN